jgi:alkanesulfonate monooxygenase SsuD/methylene tetrahydromethanopterin reductase-like flavin-dependent oxidoreductase (luciferase family)
MRYGLALPTGGQCGDPGFLVELGMLAEESGWDGVFLEDYICFQGDPREPTCDPWTALAAMAVRTRRVRLGTMVTPISRRRPWKLAREVLAIDQLSAGRMILGVGLGDTGEHVVDDVSFSSFGEVRDPRIRAEMLDEGLAVLAGLLTGEPFAFSGRHYSVDQVTFQPSSVQKPRVPIWVGVAIRCPARHDGRSAGTAPACTTQKLTISLRTTCAGCVLGQAIVPSTSASVDASDVTATANG